MMGWENIFHCEKDAFCQKILKHYWPHADSYDDIRQFDSNRYRGKIDILTGGFPCQPFSNAGKRRGTEDDRYLWPEMLRVIEEIQPRWIVGENVLGLINWNAGMVFKQVLLDLEAQGYNVQPFVLPAAGINAPHQRYRVWIVAFNGQHSTSRNAQAHSNTSGIGRLSALLGCSTSEGRNCRQCQLLNGICTAELAKTNSHADGTGWNRLYGSNAKLSSEGREYAQCHSKPMGGFATNTSNRTTRTVRAAHNRENKSQFCGTNPWEQWPTQSPLCGRNDGLSGRLDGITLHEWKSKSIKMFGNAVIPQLVLKIFQAIDNFEQVDLKAKRSF